MSWRRVSPYCLAHERGARIAKCGYRGADGEVAFWYLLYGPDRAAGWDYRAWRNGGCGHWSGREPPVRTALGEHIEQPRVLWGRYESAEQARAAWDDAQGALCGESEEMSQAADARPDHAFVPQAGACDTGRGVSPTH